MTISLAFSDIAAKARDRVGGLLSRLGLAKTVGDIPATGAGVTAITAPRAIDIARTRGLPAGARIFEKPLRPITEQEKAVGRTRAFLSAIQEQELPELKAFRIPEPERVESRLLESPQRTVIGAVRAIKNRKLSDFTKTLSGEKPLSITQQFADPFLARSLISKGALGSAAKLGLLLASTSATSLKSAATSQVSRGKQLKTALSGIARHGFFSKKLSPEKLKTRELIKQRYGEVNSNLLDSAAFTNSMKASLSKVEREALPFLREKTKVPAALGRDDIAALVNTPSPKLQAASKKLGDYLDDAHQFLLRELGNDVGFVNDFIPRIWNIPKSKTREVGQWFARVNQNPFLKKRAIETIKEGVEKFGLQPKTLDAAELVAIYDNWRIKTIANEKFLRSLSALTDEAGKKLVQRTNVAPADWVSIDHPSIRKGIFLGKAKGREVIAKVPVRVHPEIAPEMEVIFGSKIQGEVINAIETVNTIMKQMQLKVALFHHLALSEIAVPLLGARKTVKVFDPAKAFQAVKTKNYEIFRRMDLVKDAIRHGLQIGALEDFQRNKFRDLLLTAERSVANVPVINRITSKARKFNDLWDEALWDYYHNTLKITTYEKLVSDRLRQLRKAKIKHSVKQVKEEMAQLVNDTYGGQAWELMMVSPQMRQMAQLAFLSPDWTLSTLRQALSVTGIGAANQATRAIRAKEGRKFWLKAAFYFLPAMNLMNYATTKFHTGEGKFMWDNDPTKKTNVFWGFHPDGRKKFIRFGKQFRELPELFHDPVKKIGSKLAPWLQFASNQFTGVSLGGFETDIIKERRELGEVTTKTRAIEALKALTPFSVGGIIRSGSLMSIAFPVSKGLGEWEGQRLYEEAIKNNDVEQFKEITQALRENGFDPGKSAKKARASIRRDATVEAKKHAKTFLKFIKLVPKDFRTHTLGAMKQFNIISPRVEQEMIKILRERK